MKTTEPVAEHQRGLSKILPDGSELPDSTPVELPVGFYHPETIQQTIRRLVTDPAIRAEMASSGIETFDEADDFDIPEDDMPQSPHEENFDPHHLLAREQEVMAGAVRPRSEEEIAAARKIISDHKAALAAAKAKKAEADSTRT